MDSKIFFRTHPEALKLDKMSYDFDYIFNEDKMKKLSNFISNKTKKYSKAQREYFKKLGERYRLEDDSIEWWTSLTSSKQIEYFNRYQKTHNFIGTISDLNKQDYIKLYQLFCD